MFFLMSIQVGGASEVKLQGNPKNQAEKPPQEELLLWKIKVPAKIHVPQELQKIYPRDGKFSLVFQFPEGWKLNQKAPSRFAFFELHSSQSFLVFNEKQLSRNLHQFNKANTPFSSLQSFRYQGSLFICEKEDGLCKTKIVEGRVEFQAEFQGEYGAQPALSSEIVVRIP